MDAAQIGPAASPQILGPIAARRFRVSQIVVRVLDDGFFTVPGDFLAVNAPPQGLAGALAAAGLAPTGFSLPIHPMLVEAGGQLVLIDAGNGEQYRALRPDAGKLAAALRAEGIDPKEIAVVLLTHLHPDHAGGAVDAAGGPAFPNARYLVGRAEYEFWRAAPTLDELPFPDDRKRFLRRFGRDVLRALRVRLDLIEPGTEVAPGVTVAAAPGHTPGHMAVEVAADGERLLHVGDAAAEPVLNLRHPDWFLAPDNWPAHALMTRRRLLDRAAAEGLLVFSYHFAFPGLGRVAADGDGWRWTPAA